METKTNKTVVKMNINNGFSNADYKVNDKTKREIIYNEIKKTKGRFFYVEFIKDDLSLRKLNGRISVKNYPKKTERKIKTSDPLEIGKIRVYDTGKQNYRFVNFDTTLKLHINKKVLSWTK